MAIYTVPAKWLLAIPDAISQLEQLDRELLTRRDIERLFGRRQVRAAAEPAIAPGRGGEIVLPQVIVDAGPSAVGRFLEFFAGRIANARTRAAYGRAVGQFPRVVRGARPPAA